MRLLGRAREHQADPQLFAGLVQACRYCGLLTESLAAHRRARALDPNVPTSVTYTHWAVGDYPAALDAIRTDNDGFRGVVLAALNRPEEALASLDESGAAVGGVSDAGGVCRARAAVSPEAARGFPIPPRANLSIGVSGSRRVHLRRDRRDVIKQPAAALASLARAVDQGFACFSRTSIGNPRSSRSEAKRNSRDLSPKPSGAIGKRSPRTPPPAGRRSWTPRPTRFPCVSMGRIYAPLETRWEHA